MDKIKRAWVDPNGTEAAGWAKPYLPYMTTGKRFFFDPDGIWHWGEIKPDVGMWQHTDGFEHGQEDAYRQHNMNDGYHYHTADGHLVLGTLEDEDWQVEKGDEQRAAGSNGLYMTQATKDKIREQLGNILSQEGDMDGKSMSYQDRAEFYGKYFEQHGDVDVLAKHIEPSDAIEVQCRDSLGKMGVLELAKERKAELEAKQNKGK